MPPFTQTIPPAGPGLFDGPLKTHPYDNPVLKHLSARVFRVMRDGGWYSPQQILQQLTDMHSDSSITARIRDLRKPEHGGYEIECRQRKGVGASRYGRLCEYRLIIGGKNAQVS